MSSEQRPDPATSPDPAERDDGSNNGSLGLASLPPEEIADLVLPAWEDFLTLAADVDLDQPSRLRGWRAREVLVHLGSWDDGVALSRMRAEARASATGFLTAADLARPVLPDDSNASVFARHLDAPRDAVIDALGAARAEVSGFLLGPDHRELGHHQVRTLLGPLPMTTVLIAGAYELAVHALDLAPARVSAPSARLLDAGLAALVDSTGALAARHGLHVALSARTPEGGWSFTVDGATWVTSHSAPERYPTLQATAEVLLDASAGRVSVPPLLLRRELRTHHVPGLLRLAPLVEEVPGLPGGAALRTAVRHLEQAERLLRWLPGLRR